MAAMDAYMVATILPAMLADASVAIDRLEQASPLVNGFLAGYVVAMPLLGAASDRRGRLPVYVAGLAVFAAGSAVTATADSLAVMTAGRVLQGLGGGALVPLTLAMVADAYTGAARIRVLGLVSAAQEAGSVVGPAYGSLAATFAIGWRLPFWINVAAAAVVGAALWRILRRAPSLAVAAGDAEPAPAAGAARSDLAGSLLLGGGLAALALAFYPDDTTRSAVNSHWAPFAAAAAVLLAGFGWRQATRLAPLVPRGALRQARFSGALLANLLVGGALMVVLVDVPVFARGVLGVDQRAAGVLLTAFLVGVPPGALAGGVAGRRLGGRLAVLVGMGIAAAVFWVMSGWGLDALALRAGPVPAAYLELGVMGFGFGFVVAPLTAAALDATRRREYGLVSSLVVVARTAGMIAALSSLTAFGIRRFQQLAAAIPVPPPDLPLHERLRAVEAGVTAALVQEYHEIFLIAALVCVAAAAVGVLTLDGPPPTPRRAG